MGSMMTKILDTKGYRHHGVIISLFTWSKQKWLFWRAGFYPANQNCLKSIEKALIG